MTEILAQGDLLLEKVPDIAPSGTIAENAEGAAMVLAEGEDSGHRHAIRERVTMFHDDSLARDIPAGLYVGHVQVNSPSARVTHDEHAPHHLAARNLPGSPPARTRTTGRARPCRLITRALDARAVGCVERLSLRDGPRSGDRPSQRIAAPPKRAYGWPTAPRRQTSGPLCVVRKSCRPLASHAAGLQAPDGPNVKSAVVHRVRPAGCRAGRDARAQARAGRGGERGEPRRRADGGRRRRRHAGRRR